MPRLIATCLVLAASPCLANNTYFLPGDAFFFFRVDAGEIAELESGETSVINYGNHSDGAFGCGYAGLQRLQLPTATVYGKHLRTAFERWESKVPKDRDGQKRLSVFVYRAGYDWQRHGIALQYNEKWADETALFGYGAQHARLESFIDRDEAVAVSWRDSARVAPLPVALPRLPADQKGAWTAPVATDGAIQLLALPNRDFEAQYEMREGLRVFVITDRGSDEFVRENGRWRVFE